MKPIKLRIKGLNSFIEEQVIDFEKLTDRGLFGIFGPTGSGKSTILDGITLALYGKVARNSSNFINTNCERMNVNFEFQVSGAEVKRYSIDREFKRKKDGGINSGKCKIVEITNGNEVLADSVKSINKAVEEIIGLNLDDFTRTVVLPQGKFSEFLKLEGRERREMLERLFNLQKYGDNLSIKLSSKINEEKNKNNVLLGQLKGYEDVSEEKLKEKEEAFKEIETNLEKLEKEKEELAAKYKEYEELWNIQIDLDKYKNEEIKLKENEDKIKSYEEKVKLAESASKVVPYINAFENTGKELKENKIRLEKLTEEFKVINKKKQSVEKIWEEVKSDKENKLPSLILEEQKIIDCIEDEKILLGIEEKISELNKAIREDKDKISEDEKNLKVIDSSYTDKNKSIIENELKYDNLKIDESFKEKVHQGIVEEEKLIKAEQIAARNKNNIDKIEDDIEKVIAQGKGIKSRLDDLDKNLITLRTKHEELINNPPGNQNDLLELKQLIVVNEQKTKELNKFKEEIIAANKEIDDFNNKLDKEKVILKENEVKLLSLKELHKDAVRQELAHKLRGELVEGEVCPVCGSTHHIKENIKEDKLYNIEEIEEKINILESTIKDININIVQYTTNISSLSKTIDLNNKKIEDLGSDFKNDSIETLKSRFEKLEKDIESYSLKKEELEKEINSTEIEKKSQDGEIKALRATLLSNRKQLAELKKESAENEEEITNIKNKLILLKDETKVADFNLKIREIRNTEIERDKIADLIKKSRIVLQDLLDDKEKLNKDINLLNEHLVKSEAELKSLAKNRDEKKKLIETKVGKVENLQIMLQDIMKKINDIKLKAEKTESEKSQIDEEFEKINKDLIAIESKEKNFELRIDYERKELDKAILEQGFIDVLDVKKNILKQMDIDNYNREISLFKETLSKINGAIDSLIKKKDNREITKEQYEEAENLKIEKDNIVKINNEEKIKVYEEIKNMKSKLEEEGELLKKKQKLDYELSLLSDLDKLFKGKKFVEFVAAHQLKYISVEASKRLKEITHGTYGLEVDNNGRFIIRDYKNGGAERDATTLSGGETFLASLALALALSAQIQLKGTAPLELFFLDEGFGTLDDELLDVVMSSLETIHNDKLKVGIISHVESIKNRVPVKLIISPAECGMGGSKVKIERS